MTNTLAFDESKFIAILKSSTTQAHERRHDIQHNDTQHNDIQHNDSQHKEFICDNQHDSTSAIIPSVIMQGRILFIVMLSVVLLNIVLLDVVAPPERRFVYLSSFLSFPGDSFTFGSVYISIAAPLS
jgi:hypothetical protein